jgi:uncharacterized protein with PCYCGC motif
MGRKSSAKAQSRSGTAASSPPESSARSFTPLLAVAIVVAVIIGVFAYTRRSEPTAGDPAQAAATPPAPVVVDPPANAHFGPHPQQSLPPLPFEYGPPARPAEVVKAVYEFAAEHPEVLSYVPCYCGCEREGHRGNDNCFVAERNAKGDVTRWDPHGVT